MIKFLNHVSKLRFKTEYRSLLSVNHNNLCDNVIFARNYIHISKNATSKNQYVTSISFDTQKRFDSNTPPLGIAANLVNNAPVKIKPYLKLMRVDKPIGSWLLFWPCGWSIAMAGAAGTFPDPYLLALFGFGSFVMRGAGCTINDLWDKDIDAKVARTKDRPLVSGEMTVKEAKYFLIGQLSVGFLVLYQLNWFSVALGTTSLAFVFLYPYMKRITNWPQLVLGITFNWGALLGWSAVHGSLYWAACLPLYIAGVCWTVMYDTIYAHQDRIDDVSLGLKSTAIRFGDNTKLWLSTFSTMMVGSLLTSGLVCDQTWPYYSALGLVAGHLAYQIYNLNINDPANCAKMFSSNHYVGLLLFCGIVLGTLYKKNTDTSNKKEIKFFNEPSKKLAIAS